MNVDYGKVALVCFYLEIALKSISEKAYLYCFHDLDRRRLFTNRIPQNLWDAMVKLITISCICSTVEAAIVQYS